MQGRAEPERSAAAVPVVHRLAAQLGEPENLAGCLPLPGSQKHFVMGHACDQRNVPVLGEGHFCLALVQGVLTGVAEEGWVGVGAALMRYPAMCTERW